MPQTAPLIIGAASAPSLSNSGVSLSNSGVAFPNGKLSYRGDIPFDVYRPNHRGSCDSDSGAAIAGLAIVLILGVMQLRRFPREFQQYEEPNETSGDPA
jgi:hypothetical protein